MGLPGGTYSMSAGLNPDSPNSDNFKNSASNGTIIDPGYRQTNEGLYYDSNSTDSYINAKNQAQLWAREDYLRNEQYKREDSQIERYFKQLENAGINPALALSLGSSFTGSSSGQSASTYKTSDTGSTQRSRESNSTSIIQSVISALASLGVVALAASLK